ncbi:MAG: type I secretion system permease/ATPase [Sulfuricurvum sp.]|uniref:type I secretion system permease/ATPase n=1 Tax=Sulfuricurvum sp. TaxID=2025608 RepID=UPI00260640D9|nr:type I secretion system permease/ATPase [Sulfuricurvum sp.]MDD5159925.1 type I secretion system permease/ATPase [Sulfuricurvum sp.]
MLKSTEHNLKSAIKASKSAFLFTALVSLMINLLMLVPSLYMLQLYDRVIASRSEETLLMLTLIVVAFFIVMGVLEFVRSRILIRVANSIDMRLSDRIFNTMFTLANRFPSRATALPLNDLGQIRQFLAGTPLFAFFDAPWIPIYIAILFLFHPWFGVFGIFAVIIVAVLTIVNEARTKERIDSSNKMFQSSQNFIISSLRNSEVIEAMGMHEQIRHRWKDRYLTFLHDQSYASDEAGVWSNLSKLSRILMQSLILGLGGYLTITSQVTPGMMIAGSIILGRALAPLDLMTATWKQFTSARLSYARLTKLLDDFPILAPPTPLPAPKGQITLENLTIAPPESKLPSLKNISLSIATGETVGVIGPSAAGKSSFARALIGIWKPISGVVRIDGAQIEHYDRAFLGKHIGYLPQDIELFEGSVSENIARYATPDPEKVIEAAMLCGVHEMILRLPQGYDTPIGIGGTSLSGGQRQRIALARAVYDYPSIIVLDEPNSNLDDIGERALVNAIIELKKRSITVVLITHRPSILGITDKILLLREGVLQLYGKRDEVLTALSQKNISSSESNPS